MMRDCSPRFQSVDQRMAQKVASYIQYFNAHFLSSVKVMEFIDSDWKRSNQSSINWLSIPMEQILWICEHSHTLYLLAKISEHQYMFLKAKKCSDSISKNRLRIHLSQSLSPLIESIMNERLYTHYIAHTRMIDS